MDGVVEIITGRERRRRWSVEEKLRIVAETQETGARISAVAARHGLCESLVFTWRRQMREGLLGAPAVPSFVPTTTEPLHTGVSTASRSTASRSASSSGMIEIELGDGRQVRVGSDVNLAALRRVLRALSQ